MKKTLKTILIIGIVVLLGLISFVGIYVKEEYKYKDQIPDYEFASNLGKTIIATLKVDDTVNEVKYDENGKKVKEDSTANVANEEENVENNGQDKNENYTIKEEPVNVEEALTVENYKKCKEIIEKRLDSIGLPQYIVRLEENTGNIQIELQEHVNAEAGIYYSAYLGKIEIVDNQTDETVMTNEDIKNITVGYNPVSKTSNLYQVYMNVDLNNQGKEKLQNIIDSKDSKDVQNDENSVEDNTQENKEAKEYGLIFKFEDEEISTVNISDINSNNSLKINVGSESSNSTQLNNSLNEATVVALLSDSGKMPVKYIKDASNQVNTTIGQEQINIVIYTILAVVGLATIYIIVKYKKNGLLMAISNVGAISLLMIIIRYTNVLISYEAIATFATLSVVLIAISLKILNKVKEVENKADVKQKIKQGLIECIDLLVVIIAVAVVFTFINWTGISSIGMIMFWGIISIVITQIIFARTLLVEFAKK